jgi:hypothetical protein
MREQKDLLEIMEYTKEGYSPVIDFGTWRVAILNYCEELEPQNIHKFQKHEETDEIFVLLKGECILYVAEGTDTVGTIYSQSMEKNKLYNVKKSTWHSHTLSRDTMVLIVENRDTDLSNSPEIELTEEQRRFLVAAVVQRT